MSALPTPYYERDGITIYNADCRDVLPLLEPNSVDLVLTDPPYNVGYDYGIYADNLPPEEYESLCRWLRQEASRLCGDKLVLTPGIWNLPLWAAMRPSWVYCWQTASTSPAGRAAMRIGWEPIIVFSFPLRPLGSGVLNYAVGHEVGICSFPAPKPVALFKFLTERWTNPGDLILDPFMGSGTTLVAAKQLGRHAIGIEIEERWCEVAVKRLAQEVMAL